MRLIAGAGLLLGLATLTRAVLLLFPLGLAIHLALVYRRQSLRAILLLLAIYTLVVSTWTVYNRLRWQRWVIGGEGFTAFLYIGASEQGWQGGNALDQSLTPHRHSQQDRFLAAAGDIIRSDPLGYVLRRLVVWRRRSCSRMGRSFSLAPACVMCCSIGCVRIAAWAAWWPSPESKASGPS